MIEQVARITADELQCPLRKLTGFDDGPEYRLGEMTPGGGWLHDAWHTGHECGCQLLEHPPDGEVEGVDVYPHAFERHEDMPTHKGPALRQRLGGPLHMETLVREFSAAPARIGEKRADTTLDIHPGVGARGARHVGQWVERLLAGHECLGHTLKTCRTFMKRQRPKFRTSGRTRVLQHRLEIESVTRRIADALAGHGIEQVRPRARARDPLSKCVVLYCQHQPYSSRER